MPKNNSIIASIIIINFNGKLFLEKCLRSVFTQTKISHEVILVDSGSTDNSLNLIKKKFGRQKNLRLIAFKKNVGPIVGRNIAAAKSQGKYLVFLDYDTEVGQNWLNWAIDYLDHHPKIGAGQLKILKMGSNHLYDCAGEKLTEFGFLVERARGVKDLGQFDQVKKIFSGKSAAMIIKRNVFEKVGGFDNDLFMYWEEPDICWRIWKAGFEVVFLPQGLAWHAYGTTAKPISKAHLNWITQQGCRNQFTTIIKHATGIYLFKMLLATTLIWLAFLVIFLIRLNFSKAKAILKAFSWLATHPLFLIKKRVELKKRLGEKFFQDQLWLPKVIVQKDLRWYFGKAWAYLEGRPF